MQELIFEVMQESDGGYTAEALGESIFTQGDTWPELRSNVKDAVEGFYFDRPMPPAVRLHLVRDEMLTLGRTCHIAAPGHTTESGEML